MNIDGNAELAGQLGWHGRDDGAGILLRDLSMRQE
jgi:hypothetical protein